MALMVSVGIALIPFELGYLLYQSYKKEHTFFIRVVLAYTRRLPAWKYLVFIPLLFIGVGLVFTLLKPLDAFLQQTIFFLWPPMEAGLESGYTKQTLIVTYSFVALFGMLLGPIVEECYFRGYLLPRMEYAGKWAPFLHSFLFAVYHVFTPWMIVTRTLGMIPLVYAAKKANLYLVISVHILINSIDVIMGIVWISNML